jgi:hypothetical protein
MRGSKFVQQVTARRVRLAFGKPERYAFDLNAALLFGP